MHKPIIVLLSLVPSLSFAATWKPANARFRRTRLVMSASTDSKIGLYTKGKLLKVGPQAPSGVSSVWKGARGTVEITVAKEADTRLPLQKKGAVIATYPGDTVLGIAQQLQQQGIGKIVTTLKDGSIVIDTSR
jgi:hypothetical protein